MVVGGGVVVVVVEAVLKASFAAVDFFGVRVLSPGTTEEVEAISGSAGGAISDVGVSDSLSLVFEAGVESAVEWK